jgi:hypothetical protein
VSCPVGFVLIVGRYMYRQTFSFWSPAFAFISSAFFAAISLIRTVLHLPIEAASNAIVVVAFRVSSRDKQKLSFFCCKCICKIIAHKRNMSVSTYSLYKHTE